MAGHDPTRSEISLEQRRRIIEALSTAGVEIVDPDRTYVDPQVQVSPGACLFPGTHLRGQTVIGRGARVGPDCWVEDSVIEPDCVIRYSVIESSTIRERSTVGPYAHLRPGSDVGPDARVGNFVEIKNAQLARGVKAGHLSYLGDVEIGEAANIGAGTITCNYDGKDKKRTSIGAGAFIGSHSALIAPVTVGENAYIAAGSTITEDVPPECLAFGRARQVNKRSGPSAKEDESDDQ